MIINTSRLTIIPNSKDEFNIYSYPAQSESVEDLKDPRFLDSAFTILQKGDTVRSFKFGFENEIEAIVESVVISVDKDARKVDFVVVREFTIDDQGTLVDRTIEAIIAKEIEKILQADKLSDLVKKVLVNQAVNKGVAKN